MNSVERITIAFNRGQPDRVPVVARLSLPFARKMAPEISVLDLYDIWIEDPVGSIINMQEELGLDPIVITASLHRGFWEFWPNKIFGWPKEALENWREEERVIDRGPDFKTIQTVIATPEGKLSYTYRVQGSRLCPLEPPLKKEADIELLKYQPDPKLLNINKLKRMVQKVGNRAFFRHGVPGVWNEAVILRGVTQLCMDIYDRPKWVKRLLDILKDRLLRHLRRLGETGIHAIAYMQDWVGIGLSPQVYEEFILPYDVEAVQVAHEAGLMVSYHNCGRGSAFLEQMVSTGADALETITPNLSSGDFDLADVKRRVGDKICLFGGFNPQVLSSDDPKAVRDEVKRCIDAAAEGGGYILHPYGLIFDAKLDNIELMVKTAEEYSRYE
jgi:uroporphyrinogen decarboxylase